MVRLNLEWVFFPEQLISWSGQWGLGGTGQMGVGGDGDWRTDGDGWRSGLQSASVRGEQTPRWRPATPGAPSALPAPGAPMFAPARTQQSLQRHLHKSLEVIASLPSAVLRGDRTKTDSLAGDTAGHVTSVNHRLKERVRPAQIAPSFQSSLGRANAYLLASCCHLLSDHLSSAAL